MALFQPSEEFDYVVSIFKSSSETSVKRQNVPILQAIFYYWTVTQANQDGVLHYYNLVDLTDNK